MKKKAKKYEDIALDYKSRPILNAAAVEYTFQDKLTMVAIHVPTIGVVVVGKDAHNPSRCWSYPEKTSFNDAVSKTFKQILDAAAKQLKARKA